MHYESFFNEFSAERFPCHGAFWSTNDRVKILCALNSVAHNEGKWGKGHVDSVIAADGDLIVIFIFWPLCPFVKLDLWPGSFGEWNASARKRTQICQLPSHLLAELSEKILYRFRIIFYLYTETTKNSVFNLAEDLHWCFWCQPAVCCAGRNDIEFFLKVCVRHFDS